VRVVSILRYPVKSMLGEQLEEVLLDATGLQFDRGLALVDQESRLVASAKHPRLWRNLLTYSAAIHDDRVLVTSEDGWTHDALDPLVERLLSAKLGRSVGMTAKRPAAATVERPDPEDVLSQGVEAAVPAAMLEIGQGTVGDNFVDYAPVHFVTTATLAEVSTEAVRYRPNLVVETPPGTQAFVENEWVGRELRVTGSNGERTVMRVSLPTPRCAVPTLEHGDLPRAPHAVRRLLDSNRVDVPGFGVLPCAGGYAEVVTGGVVHVGDSVTIG
jgi:uncharacterized protein